MKKLILTTIFIWCNVHSGTSQQAPRLQEYNQSVKYSSVDTFLVYLKEYYAYNIAGNIISKITKEYYENGNLREWNGLFYEYYPSQKVKKQTLKHYNPDVDLWIADEWIEYNYDLNDCLVEEIHVENIGGVTRKITYEVNDNCDWIFKHTSTPDWWDNTILTLSSYQERIYFPDEISYEDRIFYYDYSGDSMLLDNWNFQIFDEEGYLVEQKYVFTHTQHTGYIEIKYNMEYDDFGNRITKVKEEKVSDSTEWKLDYILTHYNEYDENNFLIEKRDELISYSSGSPVVNNGNAYIFKYKNSCEGITEMINRNHPDYNSIWREQFVYEGKNECIDLNDIYLNIRIYPNPSNGFFNVYSPIFQTGNTEVLVYSIDGKVLLQKMEISRSTYSSMDLSFLQNGFYILQLRNGDHFLKSKIVISK